MRPRNLLGLGLLFLVSSPAFAVEIKPIISVQPIVGYERVQKFYPTQHSKDRLIYGARLLVNVLFAYAEFEYTRGRDTENFPDLAETITDTTDRAKVGLRTVYSLAAIASAHLRAGAQASRTKHEKTSGGSTWVSWDAIKYAPYLGFGFGFSVMPGISLVFDTTMVVNAVNDFKRNEYQGTAAVSVSLP